MQIDTIEELGERLARTATAQAAADDRAAYFTALYGMMTSRVALGIRDRQFDDGARMERLACHFAARYFIALDASIEGRAAPRSWTVAFRAARRRRPIILQHLMLGMNAHINYDLGIAAAEVARDDDLARVHGDFLAINDVLADLLEDVQQRLASVSPWMGILDTVGGRKDDAVVNFSMRRARDAAWRFAERYAGLEGDDARRAERDLDRKVAVFAKVILRPGTLITLATIPVRLRERASVREVVQAFAVPELDVV